MAKPQTIKLTDSAATTSDTPADDATAYVSLEARLATAVDTCHKALPSKPESPDQSVYVNETGTGNLQSEESTQPKWRSQTRLGPPGKKDSMLSCQ